MIYGYARVSSIDQNEARQIDALQKVGCEKVFLDKQSGKDFERPAYKKLMRALKEGDVLFVQSLDRFGRNYDLIKEQWEYITKRKKAHIVVIDMPLLDTRTGQGLLGQFISDIVVQLLAFVSQTERENIRKRQAEGIRLAIKRGVKFGKEPLPLPKGFNNSCMNVFYGKSSLSGEAKKLGMSRTTFVTKYRIWEAGVTDQPRQFVKNSCVGVMPDTFPAAYDKIKKGEIYGITELSRESGISELVLSRYYRFWCRQCDNKKKMEKQNVQSQKHAN